jgi:hypothetical protein
MQKKRKLFPTEQIGRGANPIEINVYPIKMKEKECTDIQPFAACSLRIPGRRMGRSQTKDD